LRLGRTGFHAWPSWLQQRFQPFVSGQFDLHTTQLAEVHNWGTRQVQGLIAKKLNVYLQLFEVEDCGGRQFLGPLGIQVCVKWDART
jgi:hypothetical protein